MLSGRRPFAANSDLGLITAILRDEPAPLRTTGTNVPAGVQEIVDRCLAKDPERRYPSAREVERALNEARVRLTHKPVPTWRRPAVLIPAALLLLTGAVFGTWQTVQARRLRWVQQEALPEIERLQGSETSLEAFRLAKQAEPYAPDVIRRLRSRWYPINVESDPAGAVVEVRNYLDTTGSWERLGTTPVGDQYWPLGFYRVRLSKTGYAPAEITMASANRRVVTLVAEGSAPPRMVLVTVPGASYGVGVASTVPLPDYWIDKFEVTNARVQEVRGCRWIS